MKALLDLLCNALFRFRLSIKPQQHAGNAKKKHTNMNRKVPWGRWVRLTGESEIILTKQPDAAALTVVL